MILNCKFRGNSVKNFQSLIEIILTLKVTSFVNLRLYVNKTNIRGEIIFINIKNRKEVLIGEYFIFHLAISEDFIIVVIAHLI